MRTNRGAALLLVLLLVALLSVIVLEFQRRARVDLRAAENLRDDLQAHALLRSGSGVTEQVLAIYTKNSIANLKSSTAVMKGGELLWTFLFQAQPVSIPAPSEGITGIADLKARLHDLYGCFPLGALVGDAVEPRRQVFKYFLAHVKEYLGTRDDKTLESVDTDDLARAIIDRLEKEAAGAPALASVSELAGAEGLTPAVVRALRPFLDVRKEWKFNANARCVPLIMAMQSKTVEEAVEIRNILRDDPVSEEGELANAVELGGLSPEFAGSLTTKSARLEVLFEASINGGARRARAVYSAPTPDGGGAPEKFRLTQWEEGWIEDEIGVPEPIALPPKGASP